MTLHADTLLENSVDAALAAIEIYNKPDFKYREQAFTILGVNAWELLLKAKVLRDAGDDLNSIYIPLPDGTFKTNRSGNPLTIEIMALIKRVSLDPPVIENINALVEIRDTVVHFYHDEALAYIVYSLGVATLRNYQKLVKSWFGRSLLKYNFHILPLAFSYNFKTLALLQLEEKPTAIANIIKMVSDSHESMDASGEFHFVCEVTTEIRSAKKVADGGDFTTTVDSSAKPGTAVIVKHQHLLDKYPLSFKEMVERVRSARPEVKVNHINDFIKEHSVKAKPGYSAYNFRNKQQEDKYKKTGVLPGGVASLYNEDAVRFITDNLDV